jgi:hypothetical protein
MVVHSEMLAICFYVDFVENISDKADNKLILFVLQIISIVVADCSRGCSQEILGILTYLNFVTKDYEKRSNEALFDYLKKSYFCLTQE